MKKLLYITNYPAPYRVDFFNELGKKCNLTVVFDEKTEEQKHRNKDWFIDNFTNFHAIYLCRSFKRKHSISFEILKILKKPYDSVIVGYYSSKSAMIAICYMNLYKIPYVLSTDGGFISKESKFKYLIKKYFIGSAKGWFSTGKFATEYLVHYGAECEKIYYYPFTSLHEEDIETAFIVSKEKKGELRKKLGLKNEKIIISVGRFSYDGGYGKGYDTLLEAAEKISDGIGIYILGDEPTEEFIRWKEEKQLNNVHFLGFKNKKDLYEYYAAADVFILLSRRDNWGLVINEAMCFALPVITTKQCGAGVELVEEGRNGYLIDAGNADEAARTINLIFSLDKSQFDEFGKLSNEKIRDYSIEKMAEAHFKALCGKE